MADLPLLPEDRNPHPQIQQDLKGDRDQAIGQAIDSTIVNFVGDRQTIDLTIFLIEKPPKVPPRRKLLPCGLGLNHVLMKIANNNYRSYG